MNTPNVTHPTTFKINGIFFKVVSFDALSNEKAIKITQHFYATHKFKKSDKGKTFTVITTFDGDSEGYL